MLPAVDSRMEWTLRLAGTGIDGQSRSFDVMAISRPEGLGDIANLGLTLAEAKLLLVQVQQEVVAAQAHHQAMFRPDCQSCGERCHVKDRRPHRIATLFGEVRPYGVRPRLIARLPYWGSSPQRSQTRHRISIGRGLVHDHPIRAETRSATEIRASPAFHRRSFALRAPDTGK